MYTALGAGVYDDGGVYAGGYVAGGGVGSAPPFGITTTRGGAP